MIEFAFEKTREDIFKIQLCFSILLDKVDSLSETHLSSLKLSLLLKDKT